MCKIQSNTEENTAQTLLYPFRLTKKLISLSQADAGMIVGS